jgi:hypothetical protein
MKERTDLSSKSLGSALNMAVRSGLQFERSDNPGSPPPPNYRGAACNIVHGVDGI